jgi:hypothetical protein
MKYPIGIQDFRKLREGGYVYVDKTLHIHRVLQGGNYLFLSRPRRFGKSLLLSTIKELYDGSRELFNDLWIESQWDWEANQRSVVWLKFSSQGIRTLGLEAGLLEMLSQEASRLNLELQASTYDLRFKELLQKAAQGGKVVLLIDEYDKPIIDYLDDTERAESHKEILKSFYSVLKDSDPYLELVFITGVSAFSKVSIFSDLNNLYNLSLSPVAKNLNGITQEEIEANFQQPLQSIAEEQGLSYTALLEEIRKWYNGYSWAKGEHVYNPFSLLNFLQTREFHNFWFETGTPTFLLKAARQQRYYNFSGQQASRLTLTEFDLRELQPIPVLFQTGYLTIQSGPDRTGLYTLDYPNIEVQSAFEERLLNLYAEDNRREAGIRVSRLLDALEAKDMEAVIEIINATFSSIPYEHWQKENEHFFHALVHLTFSLLGAYIQSEVHTSRGRLDATVQTKDYIYILEFKLDQDAETALAQIIDNDYFAPYQDSSKQKWAVGVAFSTESKKVNDWITQLID